jgi:catechol 2,3-dioxygenase-like lactoylglutathione lyase family enzyme
MPSSKEKRSRPAPLNLGLNFNHAMLYSRDLTASLRFYVDLMGFKLLDQYLHNGTPVYARFRSPKGTATIALHGLEPGQSPGGDLVRLYFETRNLQGACEKLKKAGVPFSQDPKLMPWGWTHAYLSDPDGHEISLYWAGAKRFKKTTISGR